ncbi:MAG TPA: galactose-1-epimerase, partial [Chitinophagaceae bacterium]|nr:galactose-1-epimerase [Chitinophagaceae bacterium]
MNHVFFTGLLLLSTLAACNDGPAATAGTSSGSSDSGSARNAAAPDPAGFRDTIDGKAVSLYQLRNGKGMSASVTNYG